MRKVIFQMFCSSVTATFFSFVLANSAAGQAVRLVPKLAENRVDVEIDGKLFTSYRWDERIRRPTLFPILTKSGNYITRGFPIETRDGETIDHPHQVGLSLSYGDVNGIDFWNNSPYRSEKELEHMGRIVHKRIVSVKSGAGRGELTSEVDWLDPKGKTILKEKTRHVFRAKGDRRWIDRETVLTAAGSDAVFGDSKEGLFGLHVASELEQDDQTGVQVISRDGTHSERNGREILSGKYFTADGVTGNDVWGKTKRWAAIAGRINGEDVTVVILDGFAPADQPPFLMVRGYGLLALNPFGRKQFDPKLEERKSVIRAGHSITLRYSLVIVPSQINAANVLREVPELKEK